MLWRLNSVLAGLAVLALFSGCASQPRTGGLELDEQAETITGPSTVIAGARVDEVRAVALGLARSKGWTIVSASDQKVVLRRPVSPDAPQAVELGIADSGVPPDLEVTTLFRQVAGGVNVTINAQLLARVQGQGKTGGEAAEQRIDYSEAYRDNLLQSLASLRSAWAAHHQRVARALPPISNAGQAAAETAAELDRDSPVRAGEGRPQQSPLASASVPTAWGTPDDEGLEPLGQSEPTPSATPPRRDTPVPASMPVASAPKAAAQTKPQAAPSAKPQTPAAAKPQTAAAAKPQTAAQATARGATGAKPQPVAQTKAQAATPAKTQTVGSAKATPPQPTATAAKTAGTFAAPVRGSSTPARPPAKAVPVASADNMVTLKSSAGGGSEVGNAERYAARRGCQVRPGKSIVFRRDGASEYVRVFCTGDPAFVVKCTSGACKVLE